MHQLFSVRATVWMGLGLVAIATTACSAVVSGGNGPSGASSGPSAPTSGPAPSVVAAAPASPAPVASVPDPYQTAIAAASNAFNLSQQAQSRDDWRLASTYWQRAIERMQAVPATHANHAIAQRKLPDYRRNLAVAQQMANQATPPPQRPVVVVSQPSQPATAPASTPPVSSLSVAASSEVVFRAPIVRRAGGTPVIRVTFNGNQPFDMIVDTGASGTLITRSMALALGVRPVGQATVDTASAQNVTFPLGYLNSVEVDGAVVQNLLVAIAGPELSIGLLGHDFFGNFDVTIKQDQVEFRPR